MPYKKRLHHKDGVSWISSGPIGSRMTRKRVC